MRELGLVLVLLASASVGCLGAETGGQDARTASTNASNASQAPLTWSNESYEGDVVGVEVAERNANVGPVSKNARIHAEVPEAAQRLELDADSRYGVELHVAPPSCDHGLDSDCAHEPEAEETDVQWSALDPQPGNWTIEVHSEPFLTVQGFSLEVATALPSTGANASD